MRSRTSSGTATGRGSRWTSTGSTTRPDSGPDFGLTPVQRETLLLAVDRGYYAIPRECTTLELAEELDISDQAVTERLRRAIVTVVKNTVQFSDSQPPRSGA